MQKHKSLRITKYTCSRHKRNPFKTKKYFTESRNGSDIQWSLTIYMYLNKLYKHERWKSINSFRCILLGRILQNASRNVVVESLCFTLNSQLLLRCLQSICYKGQTYPFKTTVSLKLINGFS